MCPNDDGVQIKFKHNHQRRSHVTSVTLPLLQLVKLNNKKIPTSDSAFEAHSNKLEDARAELAACESTLKAEERALVGVKRRIFREALRMRMRAMGQLADVWRDTADRAVELLDSLESDNASLSE